MTGRKLLSPKLRTKLSTLAATARSGSSGICDPSASNDSRSSPIASRTRSATRSRGNRFSQDAAAEDCRTRSTPGNARSGSEGSPFLLLMDPIEAERQGAQLQQWRSER